MIAIAPVTNRQDYVVLNTIGISHMRTGNFDNAISVFRLAVDKLLGGLADQESNTSRTDGSTQPSTSALDIGLNIRQAVELELNVNDLDVCHGSYDHNTILLYTRPFCFSDSSVCGALSENDPRMTSESPLVNTMSAMLLFNLGLSYHLRAMSIETARTVTTNRDINRRQALLVYSNAKEVLCRQEMQTLNPAQRRILLALCNNGAHLSFHFFDISTTENQIRDLRYLLSLENYNEGGQEHNDEQSYVQFLYNVLSHTFLARTSPAA